MKRFVYETIIILNELNYEYSCNKFEKMCKDFSKGVLIKREDVGIRKLAYEIKEKSAGYYIVFTWAGTPEDVAELERNMRIDDNVLKFINVKKNDEDEDDMEVDEDYHPESEQDHPEAKPDAMDVLLGFADYKKEVK